MLHGWSQNEKVFSDRTGPLRRKLKNLADLFYISAPHRLPMIEGGRDNARGWFFYTTDADNLNDTSSAFAETPTVYHKWDESREVIAQAWVAHGMFDAIVGFSQGAVVVHQLLAEMQCAAATSPEVAIASDACSDNVRYLLTTPPTFAVLVAGFASRHSLPPDSHRTRIKTPSLHVCSPQDTTVTPELHAHLFEQFDPTTAVRVSHEKGHQMPHTADSLAQVRDFFARFAF